MLAAKLQDLVTRQAATAAAPCSPNRRRSTLLTQQRVALEAAEMQQWREQQVPYPHNRTKTETLK